MEPGGPGEARLVDVVFFDRDCLLCDGSVQFLLRRDRRARLRFAPLQGSTAAQLAARRPQALAAAGGLASIVVARGFGGPDEQVLLRSAAVAAALRALGGGWAVLGTLLAAVPRPLRDWGYDLVARNRYRWFGRIDRQACPLPSPSEASRLLP
jgi:predicted DCC family thiol-disulfide oxidoreductase YuxK